MLTGAPEGRLRKFKYRGKDTAVSMKHPGFTVPRTRAVESSWRQRVKDGAEDGEIGADKANRAKCSLWISAWVFGEQFIQLFCLKFS